MNTLYGIILGWYLIMMVLALVIPRRLLWFARLRLGPVAIRLYAALFWTLLCIFPFVALLAIEAPSYNKDGYVWLCGFCLVFAWAFGYLLRREEVDPALRKISTDVFE